MPPKSEPAPAKGAGKPPRGHRQRGAGAVVADKGPQERTLGGGALAVTLKTWQKLPTTVLAEWAQKQQRPKPRYVGCRSGDGSGGGGADSGPTAVRKRVILPDPKGQDPKKDLAFAPARSSIGATSDDLAREEAALVAMCCINKDLPLEGVLPEPFRGLWLATAAAAGRESSAAGGADVGTAKSAKEIREEKQREREEKKKLQAAQIAKAQQGKSAKKAADADEADDMEGQAGDDADNATDWSTKTWQPLVRDRWYSSEYERDQWYLNKDAERKEKANLREVKQGWQAAQHAQPLYFAQQMRAECLRALRAEGKLGVVARGAALSTSNKSSSSSAAEVRAEDLEADGISLDDNASTAASLTDATAATTAETRHRAELLAHFCGRIGFEAEDVLYAVEACATHREDGEEGGPGDATTVTKEQVAEWLTLNVPEELLPESFQVKGQFNVSQNNGGAGGNAGGSSSSTAFTPAARTDATGAGAASKDRASSTSATAAAAGALPSAAKQLAQKQKKATATALKMFESWVRKSLRHDQWCTIADEDGDQAFDEATIESLMCSVSLFAEQIAEEVCGPGGPGEKHTPDDAAIEEAYTGCCDVLECEGVDRASFLDAAFYERWWALVEELKALKEAAAKEVADLEKARAEEKQRQEALQAKAKREAEEREKKEAKAEAAGEAEAPAGNDDARPEEGTARVTRDTFQSSWFRADRKPPNPPGKPGQGGSVVLPAQRVRAEFLETVARHDVTLVVGQTGCGKSTQLPAFLMQERDPSTSSGFSNVICTQPRKLAALSLARRVAQETGGANGGFLASAHPGKGDSAVGFCVRGDVAIGRHCGLVYCTVGVLLRKILENNIDFSHLVIDEAHERSLDIDFLLMLCAWHFRGRNGQNRSGDATGKGKGKGKKGSTPQPAMPALKPFKLIVMSATLDQKILDLFAPKAGFSSARMDIEGRTFPVRVEYHTRANSSGDGKINYFAVCDAVQAILNGEYDDAKQKYGKAILVFVPGVFDINKVRNMLVHDYGLPLGKVLPLHSALPSHEQKKCFDVFPGKVVISTNVCETSITISDVTAVVDTCREKQLGLRSSEVSVSTTEAPEGHQQPSSGSFPTLRLTELTEQDCAKASLEQRKGRAGRVQPGLCVRMISEAYFSRWIPDTKPSEMEVLPLENVLLQLLAFLGELGGERTAGGNITDDPAASALFAAFNAVLELAPSKPAPAAISAGLAELHSVGAVELLHAHANGAANAVRVTPLGQHLARLACDARLGKLLVYSAVLGVPREGAALAAMLAARQPLLRVRPGQPDAAAIETCRVTFRRSLLKPGGTKSDHCFLAGVLEHYLGEVAPAGAAAQQTFTPDNLCQKLHLSREALGDAAALRRGFLQGLRSLGFDPSDRAEDAPKHRWHLLRAACAGVFFFVKAKKPAPTFKKIAGGSAVELPCDPKGVRFFALETDAEREGKLKAQRDGGSGGNHAAGHSAGHRFFSPSDSVFFGEAPHGAYVVHSSVLALSGKLLLQHSSEVAPLAVVLLGSFPGPPSPAWPLEFLPDGTVSVAAGRLRYSTAGLARSSAARTFGKGETAVFNPLVSLLLRQLRAEIQVNVLARKIREPGWDAARSQLVRCVRRLLGSDGMG